MRKTLKEVSSELNKASIDALGSATYDICLVLEGVLGILNDLNDRLTKLEEKGKEEV